MDGEVDAFPEVGELEKFVSVVADQGADPVTSRRQPPRGKSGMGVSGIRLLQIGIEAAVASNGDAPWRKESAA